MKICYDNKLNDIVNLVKTKAKYQKVMVVLDETVSNIEINEIYESIKGFCVYNQMQIDKLDREELFNGYRLIIFLCSVDNYIKFGFDNSEFINVYVAKNDDVLPFFVAFNNEPRTNDNYLIINENSLDLQMMPSLCFNKFYNYFSNIVQGGKDGIDLSFYQKEITRFNVLSIPNDLSEDFYFLDFEILKQQNISYQDIVLIDLLLIDAFLLLIKSIKNNELMLVDVYKSAKEDMELIEKFYKLHNNANFFNLVLLNYNCLYNYALKTKEKIMEFINFFNVDSVKVNQLILKIKKHAKYDKNLTGYLYLYNIFNV